MRELWSGLVLCALLGCAGTRSNPASLPRESPSGEQSATSEAPALNPLRVTDAPAPKDEVAVRSIEVEGDTLVARVMHSGGCAEHTYELLWDGTFQKSEEGTARAELVLAHDAHGDRCEALLNRSPRFDLTPLARRWRELHQAEHATIELRVAQSQATARYEF